MDNILCPIDFSNYSLNALEYAANLIKVRKGNLILIHIFSEKEFLLAIKEEKTKHTFSNLRDYAQHKLSILAEQTEKAYQVNCDYIISVGDVNEVLKKYAAENDIDFIVMGTLGNGYNEQTVVGSRTIRTVESSDIPVISIPIQAQFNGLHSVVYAADYSAHDRITLQRLVSFVYYFKSRINVVHVSHTKNVDTIEDYEKFKEELSTFLAYEKISYHLKEFKDDISHGIEEFVNEQSSEMLVLLRRKKNFFENLMTSSISKEITYLSTHPLFIFQEPDE